MTKLGPQLDRGFIRHILRGFIDWLRDRTVEQHYSAESLAALLEVSPRTIWNYIEQWELTRGQDGIGPVVKLSHKVVRIPASSANRLLKAKTVTLPGGQVDERRVA